MSRLHSAERIPYLGAGQGKHVPRVLPTRRNALLAHLCKAGRTLACLARIAQSASCTYVRGGADTCVSRPQSAKRFPRVSCGVCAGQGGAGGHVRVPPE